MSRRVMGIVASLLVVGAGRVDAGFVYGVKTLAPNPAIPGVPSQPPTRLFRFNDDGTGFADLGAVKNSNSDIDVDGLALSSTHGLLGFQLSSSGSTLIGINTSTAVATTIGTLLAGRDIRGATFDNLGQLWAYDATASELLRVNSTTGLVVGSGVSLSTGFSANGRTGSDIAFRPDGTFYFTVGTKIFTLDETTGSLTELKDDTGQFLAGAAFAQDKDDGRLFVYEVNGFEDIFRYDVDSAGVPRTTVFSGIIPSFNAGRGDLATQTQVIPEPSTLVLWSLGAVGLAGLGWRRRKRAA